MVCMHAAGRRRSTPNGGVFMPRARPAACGLRWPWRLRARCSRLSSILCRCAPVRRGSIFCVRYISIHISKKISIWESGRVGAARCLRRPCIRTPYVVYSHLSRGPPLSRRRVARSRAGRASARARARARAPLGARRSGARALGSGGTLGRRTRGGASPGQYTLAYNRILQL